MYLQFWPSLRLQQEPPLIFRKYSGLCIVFKSTAHLYTTEVPWLDCYLSSTPFAGCSMLHCKANESFINSKHFKIQPMSFRTPWMQSHLKIYTQIVLKWCFPFCKILIPLIVMVIPFSPFCPQKDEKPGVSGIMKCLRIWLEIHLLDLWRSRRQNWVKLYCQSFEWLQGRFLVRSLRNQDFRCL